MSVKIDSIENGIVLDHIQAGRAMQIYATLGLDALDSTVALIKNVKSRKMGTKDLIKIAETMELDRLDALGFIDPNITISVIQDGVLVEKRKLKLPPVLNNVIRCKNPRCITSIEHDADQIFRLTGESPPIYRCGYCEAAFKD